ncbi:uncharacterized protein LOC133202861 [Saccostrea echinata]|uniref:uncharacterized protein LOC133202861 n=1 Tax=Saccostrea echinata TaxID=191078 RepID=UPI002A834A5D|nr:uncharacterized protein LOC133202861 [Saccostrea echinata]
MTIDNQEIAIVLARKRDEKVLQKELSTIKIEKHNSVADIKRCQKEMKKRLKKIRDRQREIQRSRTKIEEPQEDADFGMPTVPVSVKSQARPKTGPPSSLRNKVSNFFKPKLELNDPQVEIDPSLVSDQTKSKIDLRPATARALMEDKSLLDRCRSAGRLGTKASECRYFDPDEINDRNKFYNGLVNNWKRTEKENYNNIEMKVGQFLGQNNELLNRRVMRSNFLRQTDVPVVQRKKTSTLETHYSSSPQVRPVSSGNDFRPSDRVFKHTALPQRVLSAAISSRHPTENRSRVRPFSHK